MEVIKLREDFIKLGQALKAAGLVESGVDAKFVVQDGLVKVNGVVETQRIELSTRLIVDRCLDRTGPRGLEILNQATGLAHFQNVFDRFGQGHLSDEFCNGVQVDQCHVDRTVIERAVHPKAGYIRVAQIMRIQAVRLDDHVLR